MRRAAAFLGLLLCMMPAGGQAPPAASQERQATFGATTQEVVLDVIIRDRKGRPVKDLKAEEIEVLDAGSAVQVKSFRLVEGRGDEAVSQPAPGRKPPLPRPAAPAAEAPALDPLRQIRLVTLVFERLSVDGRRIFKQAVEDLLKDAPEPNLYFSIFYIDQRLHVVQPFTSDRALLRKAVDKVVSGSYSQFVSQSGEIARQLETTTTAEAGAEQAGAGAEGARSGAGVGDAQSQAQLARMQLNSMQFAQTMQSAQEARGSIFSLMGLVKEQSQLPGRKMLLYFSESFRIPEAVQEHFKTLISTANRSNVSIYTVDARGLLTSSQHEESRQLLGAAAQASQSEAGRYRSRSQAAAAVTPDQARMFDTVLDGLKANIQASLNELAVSTGGFLIADNNDLRTPIRRAIEEIRSYYEIAYSPAIANYDGHFRSIAVRVKRPDVLVQARSGYYALPPLNEAALFPFEIPLLNALTRSPLPRAFDYRAGVQRFDPRGNQVQYGVTVEVPLKGLTFAVDKEKRLAQIRASLLVFFKDERGAIVAKMSRDFPYDAPLVTMDAFRQGNLIQTYHVKLAPGRYTIETAVADRNAEAVAAQRAVVVVPEPEVGLAISSVVPMRRMEPQATETDEADPFHFEGGRVVPTLNDALEPAAKELPVFFAVYPDPNVKSQPELTIALLHEGTVLGRSSPELPKPDPSGRIAYVATLPIGQLAAGQYEVRAIVRHGAATTAERMYFQVTR